MAFPESITRDVRQRSHFQCCLCKAIGIEIHHIVPTSDGGSDLSDNAAPLCPSCHETYGANPTKRKFIREARDFWFEVCEKRYKPDPSLLSTIHDSLSNVALRSDIENLRADLARLGSFQSPRDAIVVPLNPPTGEKRRLGVRDLLIIVHATAMPRPVPQVELLCVRELWPVGKDDIRGIYNDFVRRFGQTTLRHLAARALHVCNVEPAEHIEESQLEDALTRMRVEALCINLVDAGRIGAVLQRDGEIAWTSGE